MTSHASAGLPAVGRFADLYTPKLLTVLREGYGPKQLRADAIAGLTVAIVALPLSMAIAIASGGRPSQGLITSIVGGFVVSAFGGSRFQIGGPAGAFIVLVAATVAQHGMAGLFTATLLAGLMLIAAGLLRLGTYIKFIPYPVTVGFTAGIAVIILASQLKDLFGIKLAGAEPGPFVAKLRALWAAAPTASPAAITVAVGTAAIIFALRRYHPHWPGMLIAVVAASVLAVALGLPVETIGTRFGGLAGGLPAPTLPDLSPAMIAAVLPNAFAFALLGAIESLLSAVVADGLSGRRHRSNCELVAQGIANVLSPLFGGICVTGTIARTATNVRAGAVGPIAGILHSAFLLVFMLVAAPLAAFIPLASLAGVLAVVCWNMVEKPAIAALLKGGRGDAAVLLVTLGLTIFRDLTEAIVVGFALGSVLFIARMSRATQISTHVPLVAEDRPDNDTGVARPYRAEPPSDPEIMVYRLSGAFFFGAAAFIGTVLSRIADDYRVLVIDLTAVPYVDSTAAKTLESLAHTAHRHGVTVILTGASPPVERELVHHGARTPLVRYERSLEDGLATAGQLLGRTEPPLLADRAA